MEQFPSRFPHYRVLAKWFSPDWDDQTRELVRRRLEEVPPIRFFNAQEMLTLEAVVERILPQPDRAAGEKVPIAPWIDEKLYLDRRDGYRYDNMPPQREAWRLALAGIEQSAAALFNGRAFTALDAASQDAVLQRLAHGDAPGEAWESLPPDVFFNTLLCTSVIHFYYAHPLAWDETGYNGPSSPRGHVRIWDGGVDPWEAQEGEAQHGNQVQASQAQANQVQEGTTAHGR